jgi:hypothetical protein
VNMYIFNFEKTLQPLFDYMKNPSRIDFDEDIVLIMTSFIKIIKKIPDSGLALLPNLLKYQKKNKGLTVDLYELLNQYIIAGQGVLETNEDYLKIIIKIFKASLDKISEDDKSAFLGASLMTIMLQVRYSDNL